MSHLEQMTKLYLDSKNEINALKAEIERLTLENKALKLKNNSKPKKRVSFSEPEENPAPVYAPPKLASAQKEAPAHKVASTTKEATKQSIPKEAPKESPKEPPKESPKEPPKIYKLEITEKEQDINNLVRVSNEFSIFFGIPDGYLVDRDEAIRLVIRYAKYRDLWHNDYILADAPLRELLNISPVDIVNLDILPNRLKHLFNKP